MRIFLFSFCLFLATSSPLLAADEASRLVALVYYITSQVSLDYGDFINFCLTRKHSLVILYTELRSLRDRLRKWADSTLMGYGQWSSLM